MSSNKAGIDTNERADFVRQLVDMANRNDELMDGTTEPVRRIIEGADLVFAIWQDAEKDFGVDFLPVKDAKLLREGVASNIVQAARTNAGSAAFRIQNCADPSSTTARGASVLPPA